MEHLLQECGSFTENATRLYTAELVLAVEHLHKVGTLSHCSRLHSRALWNLEVSSSLCGY
jgi:hypothetical protein